jgi:hypothetical protein
MRRTGVFSWLVMVAAALLLSGCGSSDSESAPGTLSVRMVDASLPGLAAIYVTVGHIDVHPQGGNWKTVLAPQTTVNLLELVNGVQVSLGLTDLAAGPYTELRLVLGNFPDDSLNLLATPHPYANYFIDESGRVQELAVPSGLQTGIKLTGGFTIASGQTTTLVLDFDAAHSLVRTGSSGEYLLKPVIKVVTGTVGVRGMVTDSTSAPLPGTLVSVQNTGATAADLTASRMAGSTLTGGGGGYTLYGDPGDYLLVAFRPPATGIAYAPACRPVTLAADQLLTVEDFVLAATPSGSVSGAVTIAGGAPGCYATLSFRQVSADCGDTIELATTSVAGGGSYHLELPVGDYLLVASVEGLTSRALELTVGAGATLVQNLTF